MPITVAPEKGQRPTVSLPGNCYSLQQYLYFNLSNRDDVSLAKYRILLRSVDELDATTSLQRTTAIFYNDPKSQ